MPYLNQLKFSLFAVFLICFDIIYAQETINTTGGNSEGVNGNVAYSVGQLLYTNYLGNNGSVSHGVLHPKETFILGIDDQTLDQVVSVYPNPTFDIIRLDVKNLDWNNLNYQLFDTNWKNNFDQQIYRSKHINKY